jgi:hypothetical protein
VTAQIYAPFLEESNRIEGIYRDASAAEMAAFQKFMALYELRVTDIGDLQCVFAPHCPLRERYGMEVRVGNHIAPSGGPQIVRRLQALLRRVHSLSDPWKTHAEFERLHPYLDGNGRTGRMLWAWHMQASGKRPFALSFLHRFYYQTLAAKEALRILSKAHQ